MTGAMTGALPGGYLQSALATDDWSSDCPPCDGVRACLGEESVQRGKHAAQGEGEGVRSGDRDAQWLARSLVGEAKNGDPTFPSPAQQAREVSGGGVCILHPPF